MSLLDDRPPRRHPPADVGAPGTDGGGGDRPLPRVGYVVKRYPRYSETFVVTEILAHEAAGLPVEIFALGSPLEPHFQDCIARVRAPVHYLSAEGGRAGDLWAALGRAADAFPGFWPSLEAARGEQGRDVHQAVLLALAVRARGVDHLHAHFASSAATVARLAARFARVPFTLTAHAKDIFHDAVDDADLRTKFAEAAAVVTVSEFNLRYLRERLGPDPTARLRRVYNGLDLARLRFDPPRHRARAVVAAGRLVEKKGFADLIEACAILVARGVDFTCQIIGDGELGPALREQAARPALAGRVTMLGARPQAEVFGLIGRGAAFAAPCVVGADSNRDGLPTVLLEAMALGTPCVSTAVTGIPEAVRDGETGIIVPQHDPPAVADALQRLLDDADLRVRLAVRARQLVEAEFDGQANAAELRELFRTAARSASPAAAGRAS